MTTAMCTGIYTLTATHVGSGQAREAVDLPITRDAVTGLPTLPSTSLKGVARALFDQEDNAKTWFGRRVGDDEGLSTGDWIFHEGQLLAYPLRALHRPFVHATCPMLIHRTERLLRALGLPAQALQGRFEAPAMTPGSKLEGKHLVVEDVAIASESLRVTPELGLAAMWMAKLLPPEEAHSRAVLEEGLVLLPDDLFVDLVARAVPVHARVALTSGKTTDAFTPDAGEPEKGNLWYEEVLPSDVLFVATMTTRPAKRSLDPLKEKLGGLPFVQIGGNETVGQGVCWWSPYV